MSLKRILILRLTLYVLENERDLRILQENKWRFFAPFSMDCEGLTETETKKIIDIRNKYRRFDYGGIVQVFIILLCTFYFEEIIKVILENYRSTSA